MFCDQQEETMGKETVIVEDSNNSVENYKTNLPHDDSYSEEIKQLRDQIPEELAVRDSIHNAPEQFDPLEGKLNHHDTIKQEETQHEVHSQSLQYQHENHNQKLTDCNSLNTFGGDVFQSDLESEDVEVLNVVSGNVLSEYESSDGVMYPLKKELSLAEELTQSMTAEDTCGSDTEDTGHCGSVYDSIINTVFTTNQEVPDDRTTSQQTRSSPKRKIIPNLELLNSGHVDSPQSPSTSSGSLTPDFSDSTAGGVTPTDSVTDKPPAEAIPEYSAREEFENNRNWRTVQLAGKKCKIDLRVIEPYKKILSHGGYYGDGFNAIIVFSGCHLPDKRRRDYQYVMDNLFLYIISTLELLVVEDYMIVYFHGATPRDKLPGMKFLKRCYDMIDRKLKKNLKKLLIVHPTFWLKTVVLMTKPFVSSKFYHKMEYVKSLQQLTKLIPTEYVFVPDEVKLYDTAKNNPAPVDL